MFAKSRRVCAIFIALVPYNYGLKEPIFYRDYELRCTIVYKGIMSDIFKIKTDLKQVNQVCLLKQMLSCLNVTVCQYLIER